MLLGLQRPTLVAARAQGLSSLMLVGAWSPASALCSLCTRRVWTQGACWSLSAVWDGALCPLASTGLYARLLSPLSLPSFLALATLIRWITVVCAGLALCPIVLLLPLLLDWI